MTCTGPDAICWARYTNDTVGRCVAGPEGGLAGVGEACVYSQDTLQCEAGLSCVGSTRNGVRMDYCSPLCRGASDCPASMPVCNLAGGGDFGFCFMS